MNFRYTVKTIGSRYGESFAVMDNRENVQVGQSFFSRTKAEVEANRLNFRGFDMFSILEDGLAIQKLIVDANHIVTDKEVKAIKDKGLCLVHKPKKLKQRIESEAVESLEAA
jgi:hypothetical protein